MKKMNNKGFSLVELIIVIAIMAILAGALAPALIKYIAKSRRSTDVNNAGTIQSAMNNAFQDETAAAAAPTDCTGTTWGKVPSSPSGDFWNAVNADLQGGLTKMAAVKSKKDSDNHALESPEFVYQIGANDDVTIGIGTSKKVYECVPDDGFTKGTGMTGQTIKDEGKKGTGAKSDS